MKKFRKLPSALQLYIDNLYQDYLFRMEISSISKIASMYSKRMRKAARKNANNKKDTNNIFIKLAQASAGNEISNVMGKVKENIEKSFPSLSEIDSSAQAESTGKRPTKPFTDIAYSEIQPWSLQKPVEIRNPVFPEDIEEFYNSEPDLVRNYMQLFKSLPELGKRLSSLDIDYNKSLSEEDRQRIAHIAEQWSKDLEQEVSGEAASRYAQQQIASQLDKERSELLPVNQFIRRKMRILPPMTDTFLENKFNTYKEKLTEIQKYMRERQINPIMDIDSDLAHGLRFIREYARAIKRGQPFNLEINEKNINRLRSLVIYYLIASDKSNQIRDLSTLKQAFAEISQDVFVNNTFPIEKISNDAFNEYINATKVRPVKQEQAAEQPLPAEAMPAQAPNQQKPPAEQVQPKEQVQQGQQKPPVGQVQQGQQKPLAAPVEAAQSKEQVQQGQQKPPVGQVQPKEQARQGQQKPPAERVQPKEQVQQGQQKPPVGQVQPKEQAQQGQQKSPAERVQPKEQVQQGQQKPPAEQAQPQEQAQQVQGQAEEAEETEEGLFSSFIEWLADPEVSPWYKFALAIGAPLLLGGILATIFGEDPGPGIVASFLGLAGTGFGLYSYLTGTKDFGLFSGLFKQRDINKERQTYLRSKNLDENASIDDILNLREGKMTAIFGLVNGRDRFKQLMESLSPPVAQFTTITLSDEQSIGSVIDALFAPKTQGLTDDDRIKLLEFTMDNIVIPHKEALAELMKEKNDKRYSSLIDKALTSVIDSYTEIKNQKDSAENKRKNLLDMVKTMHAYRSYLNDITFSELEQRTQ